MRNAALAALMMFGALTTAGRDADACAMYRPPKIADAQAMVADAKKAEADGQPRTAIRLYERLMHEPKVEKATRVAAARDAARLHEAAGNTDTARIRLEQALAIAPNDALANFHFGRLLAGKSDEAASEALTKALRGSLGEEKAPAEALLAGALARLGKAGDAEKHLERARALNADAALLEAAQAALDAARAPAMAAARM
jgi:tetratricopeptide (TPR) repeat protein